MGSLAQQRGGPHWLSDAWALLTPFPGGPRLRKASRQLAGTELGTREQGAGQAWRSGSRACVHCPRPMGQGTESSAEGARKRASEGFGAEAGLALQLEEEGGSQGKGGGRRRLEVPRSSLSPRPAELRMEPPAPWQGATGVAHTWLCGPASVFTI